MKREEFLITSTEGHNTVKFKYNSARKEVLRLMQEWVNLQAEQDMLSVLQYELVQNESEKDANGFKHVSAVMTWKEKSSGKEISFFITKVA